MSLVINIVSYTGKTQRQRGMCRNPFIYERGGQALAAPSTDAAESIQQSESTRGPKMSPTIHYSGSSIPGLDAAEVTRPKKGSPIVRRHRYRSFPVSEKWSKFHVHGLDAGSFVIWHDPNPRIGYQVRPSSSHSRLTHCACMSLLLRCPSRSNLKIPESPQLVYLQQMLGLCETGQLYFLLGSRTCDVAHVL